jgi:succinate dehydrogenase / fumarate reductase membrane anchor subunit
MSQDLKRGSATGWLWQRITGVFLAFFVVVHLNVLHFSQRQLIDFNVVSQRLKSSNWWVIFYVVFILAVLFHGLNGVWQIIHDYRPRPQTQKAIKVFLWIVGIIATVYAVYAITPFRQ